MCDYNPYGLSLLITYRVGSIAKAFEGKGLQTECFKWIGLRSHHIDELNLDDQLLESLSRNDLRKIDSMMQTPFILNNAEYRAELELMRSRGKKCELEALYSKGIDYFCIYLERLLLSRDYI